MRMLRKLPQMLRFIPGAAQDARCYFLALQYWLAGSEENLGSLVRMLVERYAGGPRRGLAGSHRAALPVSYPDVGLYHPRAAGRIVERIEDLPPGPLRRHRRHGGAAADAVLRAGRQYRAL